MPKLALNPKHISKLPLPQSGDRVLYWDAAPGSPPMFGVRVTKDGRRAYVVGYRTAGRSKLLTLGGVEILALATARKRARDVLAKAQLGGDPLADKRKARQRGNRIADLAERWLNSKAAEAWRPSTRADFTRSVRREIVPALGRLEPKQLTKAHVRTMLDKIADRAPFMADAVLACLRLMLRWAADRDLIDAMPALPKPAAEDRSRDRVLSEDEIRAVWKALDKEQSVVGDAFKLMLVTGQRRGEVLGMRWADISGSWWTIPAEQSKNGLSHRVPLSPQGLAVLGKLRARTENGEWLFPSDKGTDRSIASPGHAAQRLWRVSKVKEARVHDFRRTAASFMASLGIPRFTIARVLNHAERDVTAVYDRHSYDGEKRTALEAWGRKLDAILRGEEQVAEVVPISAGRA